jgi:putative ABC transport system substrate-binding protein
MRRREFITLVGGAAAWPLGVRAQQPRIWRLGYLSGASLTDPLTLLLIEVLRLKLRDLGYVEGQNLIFDVRTAERDFSRLPGLAAELVALRPDAILVTATPAAAAAQRATSTIPVVMSPVADPIGYGLVKSLAKPGGNITGVSIMSVDLSAKSLEFLRALVPTVDRIAVLLSGNPVHPLLLKQVEAAAQPLGIAVVPVTVKLPSDLDSAFLAMAKERCNGLVVLADYVNTAIPPLAARARLPAIYQLAEFVRFGGLLGYGPNLPDHFRRGAVFVDKIFKGAKPADLPVEQPTKFDLSVNLKTAKALGLTVPPTLVALADEVIE